MMLPGANIDSEIQQTNNVFCAQMKPETKNEIKSIVEACNDGDYSTAYKLLTEDQSIYRTYEKGQHLLCIACSAGYSEVVQVLIEMQADVEDGGTNNECTSLMRASLYGCVNIVELLLTNGSHVNALSSSGYTPLMYACTGGNVEIVKELLKRGAYITVRNVFGHTPFMEAARAGHVPVAKILLEKHGVDINTDINEFNESALTLACYNGHIEMVDFLLSSGLVGESKVQEKHTSLMLASVAGHVEIAVILLNYGAKVNMPTDNVDTPLTYAARRGFVELAIQLINHNANIEAVSDIGRTALMEAAQENHENMVSVLLSLGANINAQCKWSKNTALTMACHGGYLDLAIFLIKSGANLELGESTPLIVAAQVGHVDLVRYLLICNANVDAQTKTGDTALTYSCKNGRTHIVDLLFQYGADIEHTTKNGDTPLIKACRAGHLSTVQFLISKNVDINRCTRSTFNKHYKNYYCDICQYPGDDSSHEQISNSSRSSDTDVVNSSLESLSALTLH